MQSRFTRPLAAASFALAALIAQSANAQAPVNVAACQACHGTQGVSRNPTFPNLAGQKAGYLEAQLKAFKAKDRKNDFMNAIAGQLSEGDMHQLALYWSSLPATPIADAHGSKVAAGPAIPSRMSMPPDFPAGFTIYQTESEDGVITKRYANAVAWKAAKAGLKLPDGSIIFQVAYKAEKDAAGKEVAGAVQSYSAMESRAGWGDGIPALLRNENWDYALFGPDKARNAQLNQAPCMACHKPQDANSYVFTLDKLRMAATAAKGGPGGA
jgi:cytochrome c553